MAEAERAERVRPLDRWMRWLLYAASGLVFLAGFQLFILSEQTATTFAWTVLPPLTAASLGAAYWSSVPVEFLAARERSWAKARIAVPAVWLFTTLTLIVTLVHVDRFHFSSPDLSARAAAWLWLGIYAGVPAAMLVAAFLQRRVPGDDPPRETRLPGWFRGFLLVEGTGMAAMGVALFAVPGTALTVWPWALTLLTARALGAWLLAIGIGVFHAVREDDLARIRPLGAGLTVFAVLELVALARYPGDMHWDASGAWVYLLFQGSLLPAGLYAWFGPNVLGRFRRPAPR